MQDGNSPTLPEFHAGGVSNLAFHVSVCDGRASGLPLGFFNTTGAIYVSEIETETLWSSVPSAFPCFSPETESSA
jgi:hypothetical protein